MSKPDQTPRKEAKRKVLKRLASLPAPVVNRLSCPKCGRWIDHIVSFVTDVYGFSDHSTSCRVCKVSSGFLFQGSRYEHLHVRCPCGFRFATKTADAR